MHNAQESSSVPRRIGRQRTPRLCINISYLGIHRRDSYAPPTHWLFQARRLLIYQKTYTLLGRWCMWFLVNSFYGLTVTRDAFHSSHPSPRMVSRDIQPINRVQWLTISQWWWWESSRWPACNEITIFRWTWQEFKLWNYIENGCEKELHTIPILLSCYRMLN